MTKLSAFYAMYYSWNDKKFKWTNVIDYLDLGDLCKKRKQFKTRDDVKEYLKKEFMYRFWSKSEFEIIVSSLMDRNGETEQKIDIWDQISPNLDIITDIVIRDMNWRKLK